MKGSKSHVAFLTETHKPEFGLNKHKDKIDIFVFAWLRSDVGQINTSNDSIFLGSCIYYHVRASQMKKFVVNKLLYLSIKPARPVPP